MSWLSSNFAGAFVGLSRSQREALTALYAFCRVVDDAVDEARDPQSAGAILDGWRSILGRLDRPRDDDPNPARELSEAARRFPISRDDLRWIVDGVEMDLSRTRYRTFEELLAYCDGVASAVGLAAMAIFGGDRRRTMKYAVATGRALQLTNILRDVGEDASRGRIYLPKEDLDRFGVPEEEILKGRRSESFVALMGHEAERVRELYRYAESALPNEERVRFPAAEVMRKTYRALLERISSRGFDVFPGKIRLSFRQKAVVALSVWLPHWVRAV